MDVSPRLECIYLHTPPPSIHLGQSSDPTLWAENWMPERIKMEQPGQTHRSPHFCQTSPAPSVMATPKHSHEIHIMLRSCWHKSTPWDWCGTKATMLIVCYKGGDDGEGKKKERLFFLVTVSDWFFSEVLTKKVLLGYTFPFIFFTCHYLLEAYSCRKFTCRCEFSVLTCSWHSKKTYAFLCPCSGWRT